MNQPHSMNTKILTTILLLCCFVFEVTGQKTAEIIKISEVEATSLRVLARVEGQHLDERGVAYSLHPGLRRAEIHIPFGNGHFGSFSCLIHDLRPNTVYYFKAYADDNGNITYSTEKKISTMELLLPEVKTLSVREVNPTSARVQGCINGSVIDISGVYYSTDPENLRKGQFISTGSRGFGSFSVHLEHLQPATLYYVAFMASNPSGESVGEILSFTTSDKQD